MRSKISFFNATIFWKNVTHFWPIWTIYSLWCLWSMPVCAYLNMKFARTNAAEETEQGYLKLVQALQGIGPSMAPWVIFAFAIASAMAVFSYLYKGRSANMIHALPVRREELYITNYLSGLLFMLIPQFVSFLLTVFVWFGNGITHLEYLLQWLGIVTGETFFAYSLGIFCIMLTGNIVMVPLYFVIFNYLYKGIWSVWNMVLQTLVYGFSPNTDVMYAAGLAPLTYLREKIQIVYDDAANIADIKLPRIEGMECLGWYSLAAVAFAVLALFMYRRRQLECAGDVVAISWVKPVTRWAGAIFCAGLMGEIIQQTFFRDKILSGESFPIMLVCWSIIGVISFFVIQMIMEKSFLVFKKKLLKESGVFLVVILVFCGYLGSVGLRLEERLPKAQDVSAVYVHGSYPRYITGPERIKESIMLQKKIIASRKEYQQYFKKYYGKKECNDMQLDITYILKSGKKQRWSYNLPVEEYYLNKKDSAVRMLLEQENNSKDYMSYYFTEQYGNIEIQSGSCLDWVDENCDFQNIDISQKDAEKLVEAFEKDVEAGGYRIYPYNVKEREENTYVNTLTICYLPPKGAHILQYAEQNNEEVISEGKYPEYTGIVLTKGCKNTIALLKELGIVNEKYRLMTEKEYNAAYEEKIREY